MDKNNELKKISRKNTEVSKYDFIICPNCGHEEVGKYCPNCGQSNKDFNKPIKEIVADLLDSINLDIRLLNTLVPFFTKPGFLAQEYFNGRRKRYVLPMRMYMFFSIAFFFLVQYTNPDEIKDNIVKVDNKEQTDSRIQFAGNKVDMEKEGAVVRDSTNGDITLDNLDEQDLEKIKQEVSDDSTATNLEKQLIVGGLNAYEKKELFLDKFLKNLSYVLFLLMPFFALILAMILWKSRMLYVKHLIFSINFHSFIFGISSVVMILKLIMPKSYLGIEGYLLWGIPIYLMIGIKHFYKRRYVGAFFKALGALTLYAIVLSIVVVAILAITAKGFYK